jgi:hypothetical protein
MFKPQQLASDSGTQYWQHLEWQPTSDYSHFGLRYEPCKRNFNCLTQDAALPWLRLSRSKGCLTRSKNTVAQAQTREFDNYRFWRRHGTSQVSGRRIQRSRVMCCSYSESLVDLSRRSEFDIPLGQVKT